MWKSEHLILQNIPAFPCWLFSYKNSKLAYARKKCAVKSKKGKIVKKTHIFFEQVNK